MAASHTAKKSNKKPKIPKEYQEGLKLATQYISAWTQREFSKISSNKRIPLIWPIPGGGYIIGKRRVIPDNGYWEYQSAHKETLAVFDSKQSAIFYCLCETMGYFQTANSIRVADYEVKRLKNDIVHFDNSISRAKTSGDEFKISIWTARLDDAKLRLAMAQNTLQKSIKSAKYLKVWDN